MKCIKHALGTLLLIGAGAQILNAQNVYISEKIGTQTIISLADISKITFPEDQLLVTLLDKSSNVFAIADIQNINFSENLNQPIISGATVRNAATKEIIQCNSLANDHLLIISSITTFRNTHIKITSLEGKTLINSSVDLQIGKNQVDVSKLNQGIYFCNISIDNNTTTYKFIKQ